MVAMKRLERPKIDRKELICKENSWLISKEWKHTDINEGEDQTMPTTLVINNKKS